MVIISHVLLCNVTQRVSFWFVVTDPSRNHTLPAVEVQSAIRMNRNRINNAFFLNDQTLEFLRIPSTLAPPTDPSVPIWIIIFGVIFCIVLVATMLLILSGIRQHRRHRKDVPMTWMDPREDAENAFKVRLSIRTALGDKAYAWDTNEEYLFKAMVAFSMRKVPNRETTEISHVLLCNVTQRVSFWFVVTDPSRNHTLPAVEVQSAIRMNRNRINNAFFLNDQTLEFLRIPSTLAPPTDPSVPIWIIIFGVIFCIVLVATMLLILSGIRQHRRKNKGPSEMEDTEDKCENVITIENGIPCDPLDMKGGHINNAFVTEDERLTPL